VLIAEVGKSQTEQCCHMCYMDVKQRPASCHSYNSYYSFKNVMQKVGILHKMPTLIYKSYTVIKYLFSIH